VLESAREHLPFSAGGEAAALLSPRVRSGTTQGTSRISDGGGEIEEIRRGWLPSWFRWAGHALEHLRARSSTPTSHARSARSSSGRCWRCGRWSSGPFHRLARVSARSRPMSTGTWSFSAPARDSPPPFLLRWRGGGAGHAGDLGW